MIYEYAIEPLVLVEWASNKLAYKYVIENFGIGHPRLKSNFPKFSDWSEELREFNDSLKWAELSVKDRWRLEELYKLFKNKPFVSRVGYTYQEKHSWLQNAEIENRRHPFRTIVATSNPNKSSQVLLSKDIGDWPDKKWDAKRRTLMLRRTEDMVKLIGPLLQKSVDIRFIDPYFDPTKARFKDPFKALLKDSKDCPVYPPKSPIQLILSAQKSTIEKEKFEKTCRDHLTGIIPDRLKVKIRRIVQKKSQRFHNRYIITNLGGVLFVHGTDRGNKSEHDDVALMSRDQWEHWRRIYGDSSTEFEIEQEFIIEGKYTEGK